MFELGPNYECALYPCFVGLGWMGACDFGVIWRKWYGVLIWVLLLAELYPVLTMNVCEVFRMYC
jgi:hypothetical protein